MSTTKMAVGIVAASLLFLGVGGYQWQQTVRERGELNLKLNQIQAQRALAAKLRDEATAVDRSSAKPSGNVRAAAAFRPPSTTELYDQAEATYPEIRWMLANFNRAWLNRFLGGYVARAGLSEAQRTALYAAELDAVERRKLVSFSANLPPSEYQLPRDQLVAIVGEAAAAQFDGYIQRLPAEKVVSEAALKAGMAGVPLSTDQQDRFAQVIAAAAKLNSNNPTPDFASMDLQSVMGQSAQFLNSEQLAAVKGALTQEQYNDAVKRATQAQSQGKAVATDKP